MNQGLVQLIWTFEKLHTVLLTLSLVGVTILNNVSAQYPGSSQGGYNPSSYSTSQDTAQRPPLQVRYFKINDIGYLEDHLDTIPKGINKVDIILDDIHHYRLGSFYSAVMPSRFRLKTDRGNNLGIDSYDKYREYLPLGIITSPNRVIMKGYYATRFGDALRNINIDFSRTFARKISFGFRIYSGESTGQFAHQESKFSGIEFNITQRSNKDRRRSYAHFNIVRNQDQINGGLSIPDNVFTESSLGNLSYTVNNSDPSLDLKNTTFKMGTSITLGVDSIETDVEKIAFAEIGTEKERFNHIEANKSPIDQMAYLPVQFLNRADTFIRSNLNIYEKIGIKLKGDQWSLGSNIQIIQQLESQKDTISSKINNGQYFINVDGAYKWNKLTGKINGYQELGGRSERKLDLSIHWKKRFHRAVAYITTGSEAPGLFQESMTFNNTTLWQNDFSNQSHLALGLKYTNPKTKTTVHAKALRVNDYVYMKSSIPSGQLSPALSFAQDIPTINIQSLEVSQDFKFKFIELSNLFFIQTLSEKEAIQLPELSSRHDVSLAVSFFKKKLKTKVGSIIWMQRSTGTPSFHPFLNEFYYPSPPTPRDFIRISPYIRADISGLEVFISYDDLERGLNSNLHYFDVQGYPSLDSKINLAFRVRLLD